MSTTPNEDKKEERKAYKARHGRESYTKYSEAKKQGMIATALDRYRSETPEQRLRRNALWRQAWARRKRKAELAKMSEEQRKREVERWDKLAPEEREAENTLEHRLYTMSMNAIDDLGTDTPDRSLSTKWSYSRDKKVRNAVRRRAKGKCEFCGKPGFMGQSGKPYLETHHVIALSDEGADRLTNVIALCPNDHREAHFGKRCAAIETEMILKLKAINR
jgi:5-methylcytosine-specific restriction endonuclease McrA